MVCQVIDMAAVRKAIPRVIELVADRRVDLDGLADFLGREGDWPEWQTNAVRDGLRRLRDRIFALLEPPSLGAASVVDQLVRSFALPADQAARIRNMLEANPETEAGPT